MTSQLNVDTIVDKAGSGGSNVKMANTSTYVSDGGGVTQNTVQGLAKCRHSSNSAGSSLFGSFNVSSLGDTATGKETINFTNDMSDRNYSVVHGSGSDDDGNTRFLLTNTLATNSYQVQSYNSSSALSDNPTCSTAFGDLA